MKIGLIGRKQGMSQIFDKEGNRVPVTVLVVGPCVVTQVKTKDKDGYCAVQIAFEDKRPQSTRKSDTGHFKKAGITARKNVREFRVTEKEIDQFKVGMVLSPENFQVGDLVDVEGVTKGRGFQGVIKRHGYKGFDMTHGTHEMRRATGSVGQRTHPGRIIAGKGMAGHMGDEKMTVQNIRVVEVNAENNALLLRGSVPGHKRAVVLVRHAIKRNLAKRDLKAAGGETAPAEATTEANA